MALERNPRVAERAVELGFEICSHGYRWIDYQDVPDDIEREHIQRSIDIIYRLTGERPLGWYTGAHKSKYTPARNRGRRTVI